MLIMQISQDKTISPSKLVGPILSDILFTFCLLTTTFPPFHSLKVRSNLSTSCVTQDMRNRNALIRTPTGCFPMLDWWWWWWGTKFYLCIRCFFLQEIRHGGVGEHEFQKCQCCRAEKNACNLWSGK